MGISNVGVLCTIWLHKRVVKTTNLDIVDVSSVSSCNMGPQLLWKNYMSANRNVSAVWWLLLIAASNQICKVS